MTAEKTIQEKLATPVNPKFVAERKGLSYVTGRYVKSKMNQLLGPENWDLRVMETKQLHLDKESVRWFTHVRVTANVDDRLVVKDGIAVGHGTFATRSGYATEGRKNEIIDFAAAESVTDATKRAVVGLGEALGLSLYPIK